MRFNIYHYGKSLSNSNVPETMIILGNPASKKGLPGKILLARLNAALSYYQRHNVAHIIVSGGAVYNSFEEAEVQKNYLVAKGIPEKKIIKEPQARNTPDNALYSYRITQQLQFKNIVVVTSGFHSKRSAYIFSHYFKNFKIITPVTRRLHRFIHFPYWWDRYCLWKIKKGDDRLFRK